MLGCECFCWHDKHSDYDEFTPLPQPQPFSLPSPIPDWPPGQGFATGKINLGELEVVKITKFESVWSCDSLHGKAKGATFYKPVGIPDGFFCLGYYCQPNDQPLRGYVLVAREREGLTPEVYRNYDSDSDFPALKKPVNYSLIWSSDLDRNGCGFFWLPNAPMGYKAMGILVTGTPEEPDDDEVRCVREDLTETCEIKDTIHVAGADPFQVWNTRPCKRGMCCKGVSVGTFFCSTYFVSENEELEIVCLKNLDPTLHAMPDLNQIHALINHYGATVFFHPDEDCLPSSVQWFFKNGALLYEDGELKGKSIDYQGSNLPSGGTNDGAQKQVTSNANPNSTPNCTMLNRQKSSKRGGNSSGSGLPHGASSHQHPSQPPPPPPFAVPQMPPSSFGNFVPAMPYPSTRDPQYRGNSWETRPIGGFASQSHKDHRHSSRRGGNYGPRGDGGYNNNFWGRREQDSGNYGNARDGHMQPPRAPPRGFPRPSPPAVHSFVPSQPVRPFMNPIGYPEYMYFTMEPFRGMPSFTPAMPPMFMPVPEPSVSALLLHQIDYYFSDNNLVKDDFLKSNMDDQGWVAISLIAGFPRVKSLTSNIQLIVDSLRSSTVVEVQDEKVRRRNDWKKWVPYQVSTVPGSLSPGGSSPEMLASSFQQITVREESTNQSGADNVNPHAEDALGRHPSDGHSHLSNGDGSDCMCLNQN